MTFLANLAWLVSSIPSWIAFRFSAHFVKRTQERLLHSILKNNSSSEYGRKSGFSSIKDSSDYQRLPLTDYEDYLPLMLRIKEGEQGVLSSDKVRLLEPTGGSTSGTKLVPYTGRLQRQFRRAIDPWISGLFFGEPGILFLRQYWSISPNTVIGDWKDEMIKVGFNTDYEYLGRMPSLFRAKLFAVPPELASVKNSLAFDYLTMLFLVRERNLGLISVWHPSFLTLLLDRLPSIWESLLKDIGTGGISIDLGIEEKLADKIIRKLRPDRARANELSSLDISVPESIRSIWPRLKVISCWADGSARALIPGMKKLFPGVRVQPKGLIATEGIISFPFGMAWDSALAIRSHYFEFKDTESGAIVRAWELVLGKEYSVILTTDGLYRYRMHDIIKVTGKLGDLPIVEFLSKEDLISDCVGEKLDSNHVSSLLNSLAPIREGQMPFCLLAPEHGIGNVGYVLFAETVLADEVVRSIADEVEKGLCRNYQYQHARNRGQLVPLRPFRIDGKGSRVYVERLEKMGKKRGDIKPAVLSPESGWANVFNGNYI